MFLKNDNRIRNITDSWHFSRWVSSWCAKRGRWQMSIMNRTNIRILEAQSRGKQKAFMDLWKWRLTLITRARKSILRRNTVTKYGKKNLWLVCTKSEDDVAISANELRLLSGSTDRRLPNGELGSQKKSTGWTWEWDCLQQRRRYFWGRPIVWYAHVKWRRLGCRLRLQWSRRCQVNWVVEVLLLFQCPYESKLLIQQ